MHGKTITIRIKNNSISVELPMRQFHSDYIKPFKTVEPTEKAKRRGWKLSAKA